LATTIACCSEGAASRTPPRDWTIEDIRRVCKRRGWQCLTPSRGSHWKVAAEIGIMDEQICKLAPRVRAIGIRSPLMDWIISSQDEATGRVRATHYATETSFHAALKDMFSDIRSRFLLAELPDGSILDEDAARELVGAPHGSSWQ
jgi:hypothetical protein